MELNGAPIKAIKRYLGQVAANLRGLPEDEQQDILEEVERHIHDALSKRTDGQPTLAELRAVIAEMDPPESYNRAHDDTAKPRLVPVAHRVKPPAEPDHLHGDRPTLIWASVRAAIVHALMPLGIVVFLTFRVPKLKMTFDEFDVALPWLTQLAFHISDFLKYYGIILLFPVLLLFVADAVIYYFLRRRVGKVVGIAWYAFVLLTELACVAFWYIATTLPLIQFNNSTNI